MGDAPPRHAPPSPRKQRVKFKNLASEALRQGRSAPGLLGEMPNCQARGARQPGGNAPCLGARRPFFWGMMPDGLERLARTP